MAMTWYTTCFFAFLALSNAQMTREQLRSTILAIDPVFAHRREDPMMVSQNTNIFLPTDAAAVASGAEILDSTFVGTVEASVQADTPVTQPAKGPKPNTITKTIPSPSTPKPTTTTLTPDPMHKNKAIHEVKKPIPAEKITDVDMAEASRNHCSFKIPYPDPSRPQPSEQCPTNLFIGPDMSLGRLTFIMKRSTNEPLSPSFLNRVRNRITQSDFDKKCLLPALHAQTLGEEACRSNELTAYLQWLMYLRHQLDQA
ncbi:uncharacterized protein LOC128219053 [Mya arenaria]|nr:uncharacterized protein LOC128219053 [Mya arenaria]